MKKLLLSLVLALVVLAAFPAVAVADAPVNVVSSEATPQFPQAITFTLEAESATAIEDIDLEYRVHRSSVLPVSCRVDVDFNPGTTVDVSWTWNMLETGGLPPGAEIEYRWLIQDADGELTETAPSSVQFNDTRHDWNSVSSGQITVLWYEGDLSFAQQLLASALDALQRLEADIGVSLEEPATIYVYADVSDLQGALVYPQEWTGGVAFYDYGIIAIGIPPGSLDWGSRAIAHELGHLVTRQAIFGPYGYLPTWLDEGLAMDAEPDLRSDLAIYLATAIASDTLFSIRSICSSFPSDTAQASLCYAESYSAVQFLLDSYGRSKLVELLGVFKDGSTCDDALLAVYGFDVDGFNVLWRESLGLEPEPTSTPGSQGSSMPVLYIALIAIVGALGVVFVLLLVNLLLRRTN